MEKVVKKISLVLFSILFGLVFLEALLQLAGFSLSVLQRKNLIGYDFNGKNIVRVLAIGESTTAHYPKYSSWPSELEKILNSKQNTYKFIVINEATPGTFAMNLAVELPEYLKKYDPDVVISMIGINEKLSLFKFSKEKPQILSLHFNKLDNYTITAHDDSYIFGNTKIKLFKFAQYIYKNIINHKIKGREETKKEYVKAMDLFLENKKEMELKLEEIVSHDPSFIPARVALEGLYISQKKVNAAQEIKISKQINFYPVDHVSVSLEEFMREVYHDIYDKVEAHNATLIAMQYPTLPVEEVENLFTEDERKNIHFISNEKNFKDALKKTKYEDIFYDSFAGTFGHSHLVGNQLIAENVANKIFEIYSLKE